MIRATALILLLVTASAGQALAAECDACDSGQCNSAPEVILTSADRKQNNELNWQLSSRDEPSHWTAIAHGPLTLQVVPPEGMIIDFVEVMLDGKPYSAGKCPPEFLKLTLTCPPLGRHLLQARYLSDNCWSELSPPLRFEVRLPNAPEIVAVADSCGTPLTMSSHGLVKTSTSKLKLQLANVDGNDNVVAYLDGEPVPLANAARCRCQAKESTERHKADPCCRIIDLEGIVSVGVHILEVRTTCGACGVASPQSNAVMLHYFDEELYVLKPDSRRDAVWTAAKCAPNSVNVNSSAEPNEPAATQTPDVGTKSECPKDSHGHPSPCAGGHCHARTDKHHDHGGKWGHPNMGSSRAIASAQQARDEANLKRAASDEAEPVLAAAKERRSAAIVEQARLRAAASEGRALANTGNTKADVEAKIAAAVWAAQASLADEEVADATAAYNVERDKARNAKLEADSAEVNARNAEKFVSQFAPPKEPVKGSESRDAPQDTRQRRVFYFAAPAQFPLRDFGPRGEVYDREGAVIYEDMQLAVFDDGQYQVRFRARSTAIPATLRLQILLQAYPNAPWDTITLESIKLQPGYDRDGRPEADSHTVVVCGSSEVLARSFGNLGDETKVRRQGTARFGYGTTGTY